MPLVINYLGGWQTDRHRHRHTLTHRHTDKLKHTHTRTRTHTHTHTHTRVGRYHIFTSGIRYYKLRTVFGIPRFLIKQVDEPLSSVNG